MFKWQKQQQNYTSKLSKRTSEFIAYKRYYKLLRSKQKVKTSVKLLQSYPTVVKLINLV